MKKKVLFISNIPAPYRIDFYSSICTPVTYSEKNYKHHPNSERPTMRTSVNTARPFSIFYRRIEKRTEQKYTANK